MKLGAVSVLATGNELLHLNPIGEDALEKFIATQRLPALRRFLSLSEHSAAAQSAAIKRIQVPPPLAHMFFEATSPSSV